MHYRKCNKENKGLRYRITHGALLAYSPERATFKLTFRMGENLILERLIYGAFPDRD